MRRALDCDFFLGEEEPEAAAEPLRVFAGPRGIVIADGTVALEAGERVRHGEAFETRSGIDFVFYPEPACGGEAPARVVNVRFVVRDARFDEQAQYRLRSEMAPQQRAC